MAEALHSAMLFPLTDPWGCVNLLPDPGERGHAHHAEEIQDRARELDLRARQLFEQAAGTPHALTN